ncbi:hypothetical protein SLS56_005005 [Neofusicoccum ribis]|uniref:Uncharacterized protein n=1 Tax=Neofusicoccum ribis TaxID=45134 RepID=A0ABR3SWG8_9PEZI
MRAGHGRKSPVLRTAAVLLLVLSIATTSASAAAVIDPSANTRRIQPPDSNNTPRSPTPPPPSSLSNSTHTFSSDPASYPDQADTASTAGTASTEATSRRRPRPWQWGPPRPKRDGTLLHDVAAGLDRDRDASTDPSSDEQAASTASADDIEARRRPDGWRNDRRDELSHTEVKRDSDDSDSDDHDDDDHEDDDDDDDDDGRSHVGIGTWAGIIVGASVGAVLVAAGGYALVVGRRRRRGSIAEQKALYAQARKEDERRVWEGDDDEGDWGMGSRHGNGGGGGVGDLEKGGLVVTVEDYRGVR